MHLYGLAMIRLASILILFTLTFGSLKGQSTTSGLKSTYNSMQNGVIRCMVLPTIIPTNVSSIKQPFAYWYNKVDQQYGSLRATLQTSDLVIAPMLATIGEAPFGNAPLYSVPDDWFKSISSLGITHTCLSNLTTLRAKPSSVIRRTDILRQEGIVPIGLFGGGQTESTHCVIQEIKGLRLAIFSFVYPFYDYNGQFGMSGFDVDQFAEFYSKYSDSIDCWIAIPSWKNAQYGAVSSAEQIDLMNTLSSAGFDIVIGYSGKHMCIETMSQDSSKLLLFDVGTALPASVSQTASGVLVEFSIDTTTKLIQNAGLIPIYPLLVDQSEEREIELVAVLGRDLEVSEYSTNLSQDQEIHFKEFMAKFRHSKPSSVKEFYYPQSLAIRNDASNAAQLHKGWEVDTTIYSGPSLYGVQFLQLSRKIMLDTTYYKHLRGYSVFEVNKRFHYVLGKNLTLEEAESLLLELRAKSHEFAQIIQIKGSTLVSTHDRE